MTENRRPGNGQERSRALQDRPFSETRRMQPVNGNAPRQNPQQPSVNRAPAHTKLGESRYYGAQPDRRAMPTRERIERGGNANGEFNFKARQAQRRKQRRTNRILLLAALVVVVIAVFAITIASALGSGANTFYEGITIDGLRLNGYTKEEAKAQLQNLNTERIAGTSLKVAYDGREWTIAPDQMGVTLNIDEKLEEAWNLGRQGNIFARKKEIKRLKKEGAALFTGMTYSDSMLESRLYEVKESIDLPATDASIAFDPSQEEKFRITQESTGRSVNLNTLMAEAKNHLDNDIHTAITVQPEVVNPSVYAADLENCTERIVRTTTDLGSSSDARIHNVKLAVSFFNGMVVQPGQEVSFNKTTGPRTEEEGYENAGVILDDEIVDGAGGGVCQASTTLYHAVVKAGLEIVRSNKHSLPVSYVDVGTDAAVAYDYKDLVFRNNTDTPIFIEGRVSGKTVSFSIYGKPLDEGVSIDIVTDIYEKIEPAETEIILDNKAEFVTYTDETKVKKKARTGYKVRSYRVYKLNGEETSREQLRDDYYEPVQGVVYQGVTPRASGSGLSSSSSKTNNKIPTEN